MVKVDTTDGVVLLASDAVHFYEEYEDDIPFMFVNDLHAMYRTFDPSTPWRPPARSSTWCPDTMRTP